MEGFWDEAKDYKALNDKKIIIMIIMEEKKKKKKKILRKMNGYFSTFV